MAALTEAGLCELVAATLRDLHPGEPGTAEVTPESRLDGDLGFDSLGRVDLFSRIERAAGVALPEEALQSADTVADLWRAVEQGRPAAASVAPIAPPIAPPSAPPASAGGAGPADVAGAQTLVEVLDARVRGEPERVHLICLDGDAETRLTHRQLAEGAAAVAAGLLRAGLRPRQTVAIMLPTSPEYFFTYFGILCAGGIPVPIYPPARASQLEEHVRRHTGILANAQARLMVSVPQAMTVARLLQARVPGLRQVLTPADLAAGGGTWGASPVQVRVEDVAFIQYTSGSTGAPKGVALTHANLLANIRAMARATRATPDDVFVSWLPLYHDMGLIGAWLGGLVVGFPLVVMSPLAFLARPQRWLEAITRYRGTLSAAPNFAYQMCLARIDDATLATLDLRSWRLAFNGAEAVSPDTVERFARRFAACGLRPEAVAPVYGLAEASVGLLFPPPERGPLIDRVQRAAFEREHRARPAPPDDAAALRFVACGRPLPGHEVRIVDEEGLELPGRVEGRLEFRGPSATRGYWRNPAQTARLFDRGWLDTGDRAYLADGEVYVTGRVKDIVIRGGRNLHPQEIEEAVAAVDGVRKGGVAVFGRPDERTGTEQLVVLAEVDPRRAREEAAVRAGVAQAVVAAIGEPADEIVLAPPAWLLTVLMPTPAAAWGFARRAARLLLRGAGVPVTVRGLEHWPSGRPCVLVCNHGSYLDGVALVSALPRPCTFVAKQELADQFVAGRFLRRLGALFVERFDARRSVVDSQRLAQAAGATRPLLVFPEGTFRADPTPLPFHLGGFLAAAQAGVPVLPLVLSGTREVLPDGSHWPRRGQLVLHVELPIEPPQAAEPLHAAVALRDATRSVILRRLSAEG